MACLGDQAWVSHSLSDSDIMIKEEKRDYHQKPIFFEKVFPIYALGIPKSESDPDSVVSVANLDSDPIWDAVKREAKLEVSY